MADDELVVSKLIVRSADGAQVTIEPDRITFDGGPQRGFALFGLDGQTAGFDFWSSDGQANAKLRVGSRTSGLTLTSEGKQSSIVSSGVLLSGSQKITLTSKGVVVKDLDDEPLFVVPFDITEATDFVRGLGGGIIARLTGWLASKFKNSAAS